MFRRKSQPPQESRQEAAPVVVTPAPVPGKGDEINIEVLRSLTNLDRVKALQAALRRAHAAGTAGPYFDEQRALRALTESKMRLTGTPEQIQAQILVHRGLHVLLKSLFAYSQRHGVDRLNIDAEDID